MRLTSIIYRIKKLKFEINQSILITNLSFIVGSKAKRLKTVHKTVRYCKCKISLLPYSCIFHRVCID